MLAHHLLGLFAQRVDVKGFIICTVKAQLCLAERIYIYMSVALWNDGTCADR